MSENLDDIRNEMEARPTPELISILRNREKEDFLPETFQYNPINSSRSRNIAG